MASEPDDYQTISENCPGYMILVSEGIICTRCSGEKRHRPNDCPKPATAASLVTDNVPDAELDGDGMDNADSEMESLSDTESLSSESTGRSDSSEIHVTSAGQFDQGGNHPPDTHLPRRGFASPDASRTSTQPGHTTFSSSSHRSTLEHAQTRHIRRISHDQRSHETSRYLQQHPPRERDNEYGPNSLALHDTQPKPRSGVTSSTAFPYDGQQPSSRTWSDKTKKGARSHSNAKPRRTDYEVNPSRLTSKLFADTTGKFDFDNTTCPSSFGFGRLPSEAMG